MVCRAQSRFGFWIVLAMLLHPVAQRSGVDLQLPGDLGDRALGLDNQLHRLSLELRTELPT